ncbi:hypothetical protein CHKEEEPN_4211 [Methylorubrum podarium]|nr:hypothetical protein CHKEEEPN_4211 [Methylorubrum podarium]
MTATGMPSIIVRSRLVSFFLAVMSVANFITRSGVPSAPSTGL